MAVVVNRKFLLKQIKSCERKIDNIEKKLKLSKCNDIPKAVKTAKMYRNQKKELEKKLQNLKQ